MVPSPPLSVFICDSAQPVIDGLIRLLTDQPALTLCGTARTLAASRPAILAGRPDVLIMELNFPDGHAFSLIRGLREAGLETVIVVFSIETTAVWRELGLAAGADYHVEKSTPIEQVLALVAGLASCRTLIRRERRRAQARSPFPTAGPPSSRQQNGSASN